jgi:hypothetical protein
MVDVFNARWGFATAAAATAAASSVIPALLPASGQILLMAGDPDTMRNGANEWRGNESAGSLRVLGDDLLKQAEQINTSGHWKGTAYATFQTSVADFQTNLGDLEDRRRGVADGIDSAANLYQSVCNLCMAVGTIAGILAAITRIMMAYPAAWVGSQAAIQSAGASLARVLGGAAAQQRKYTFKASVMLTALSYLYSMTAAKFPGMQPITMAAPQFTSAQLAYDRKTFQLGPPQNPKMPEVDTPGLLDNMSI